MTCSRNQLGKTEAQDLEVRIVLYNPVQLTMTVQELIFIETTPPERIGPPGNLSHLIFREPMSLRHILI